jgi:Na+-transporting NADH:ubiquinone oxidoreductase subunit C
MKKGIIYTVIFTLITSFIFVFILSCMNEITKEITERNADLALQRAVLKAFHVSFTDNGSITTVFNERIEIIQAGDQVLYSYKEKGNTGYGIQFHGNALWGPVTGILAVNADTTMIIGIEFIAHNETPGLGGRIDEEVYKDQFRGELLDREGRIFGTRNGTYDYDHQNSTIDNITGATRTSESIIIIVNNELSNLRRLVGGLY